MIRRRIKIFITLLFLNFCAIYAQSPIWHANTAKPIEKGHWEIKLLHPSRYGIRRDIEISSLPTWFYYMPNVSIKKAYKLDKIKISTKHSLFYYTPALNYLKNNNENSSLQKVESFGTIMGIKNEFLYSKYFSLNNRFGKLANIITGKLAFQINSSNKLQNAPGSGESIYFMFNEIQYFPFIVELGGQLDGRITEVLNYTTKLDYSYFGSKVYSAFTNESYVIWYKNGQTKKNKRVSVALGYKLYWRFKENGHDLRVYPSFDLIYRIGNRFDASKELFIEDLKYF